MAFSCGVGAPGARGAGVRIVVRCFMERREVETWVIRRVVKAPVGRLVGGLGSEGGGGGGRTEAEPEVCVWDVGGHGEVVQAVCVGARRVCGVFGFHMVGCRE